MTMAASDKVKTIEADCALTPSCGHTTIHETNDLEGPVTKHHTSSVDITGIGNGVWSDGPDRLSSFIRYCR